MSHDRHTHRHIAASSHAKRLRWASIAWSSNPFIRLEMHQNANANVVCVPTRIWQDAFACGYYLISNACASKQEEWISVKQSAFCCLVFFLYLFLCTSFCITHCCTGVRCRAVYYFVRRINAAQCHYACICSVFIVFLVRREHRDARALDAVVLGGGVRGKREGEKKIRKTVSWYTIEFVAS